ncbi:MAG: type II toxin-antitoxin system RelE/ParE family toxin [Elusimicrobiales bacterium]|nr:type II toxin-antitoxin system RelE/ParE family toxin [Elusimicrobiales bacterium]
MDISPVSIQFYMTVSGRCPFEEWLHSLDSHTQHAIDARVIKLRRGLFGDFKHLGEGIYELRFHFGPGYRIYYGIHERTLVLLLEAGDKKSQTKDIEVAKYFWRDFIRRHRNETH